MRLRRGAVVAILITCVAVTTRSDDHDTITVATDPGPEQGLIIWTGSGTTTLFRGLSVQVANYRSTDTDQVVSFTQGRPPAIRDDVIWHDGSEEVKIEYPPAFEVPVKVWVLYGGRDKDNPASGISATLKTALDEFRVSSNELLTAEHVGFTLSKADGDQWVSDQTQGLAKSTLDKLMKFNLSKCSDFDDAVVGIKREGAINIYVVRTVDGKSTVGRQCIHQNFDSAVVGRNFRWDTILHEIGHALSLEHISKTDTWFDAVGGEKNLMCHYTTDPRSSVTEGQIYRMYISTKSGFNQTLASIVPSQVKGQRRDCKSTPLPCLHEEEMAWPDH